MFQSFTNCGVPYQILLKESVQEQVTRLGETEYVNEFPFCGGKFD
jgi:hypothetical protein